MYIKLSALLVFFSLPYISAIGSEKPNIVFILVDDMGYGDLSCNNPESKIQTPNIDQIANEGIRFTDAHSGGSSCIPSRYALMTGRFATRTSMSLAKGPLIEEDRMTIASLLHDAGYRTTMVGKWHLGFQPFLQNKNKVADYSKPLTGGPADRGFDYFFGMHASLDLPPYFYIHNQRAVQPPTATIQANDSTNGPDGWNNIQGAFWRAGMVSPDLKLEEVTPRFIQVAENVIKNHADKHKEKPLFLYLALPSPHTPWLPLEKYKGKSGAGMYGDFVMQVDESIGQVTAALEAAGMKEDTLIIFSSDNGPVWYEKDVEKFGHQATGDLRGMKFSSWEGGHRMPFLVSWPAKIKTARTCDQTIVFSDVFATFAGLVGAKIPDGMAEDSVSFLSYLSNGELQPSERPPIIHDKNTIRAGNWKLILPKKQKKPSDQAAGELYSLTEDLSEQNNLISKHPEIAEKLKQQLKTWLENSN